MGAPQPWVRCAVSRPDRVARFAAILGTMHAAHDVADHVVQTDRQAAGKAAAGGWVRPMAGHVGSYHAVMCAALLAADRVLGLGLSRRRLAAALAVSAGTHAFLDRRWPVRRVLELTGSPGFAKGTTAVPIHTHGDNSLPLDNGAPVPLNGPYLADQSLHHGALWLAALVAAAGERAP